MLERRARAPQGAAAIERTRKRDREATAGALDVQATAVGLAASEEDRRDFVSAVGSLRAAVDHRVRGRSSEGHEAACGCGMCAGRAAGEASREEEEESPISIVESGRGKAARPEGTPPTPQRTSEATSQNPTPATTQTTAPSGQAASLTITSATSKAAPSGAPSTRANVGVGEVVTFTGSSTGTWTATTGTRTGGAAGATFVWTAPATAGSATITLTAGTNSTTKAITVVAPNGLSMVKTGADAVGAGGACMRTSVTVSPLDVCLGNTMWLEVPGPATRITGFFTKFSAATLYHNPNPSYVGWNDRNTGPTDHASWHSTPGPYSVGSFRWSIPNRYKLDGEADAAGRLFTTTTQIFTMDATGKMVVTKAGAST